MKHAVRAIILKDDNLLVMKRNKFGLKYNSLIGGAVELGEELDEALLREIAEETNVTVSKPKLVFIEEVGPPYGTQYIYLCKYISGDVVLSPDSPEFQINKLGLNLYEPAWVKFDDLSKDNFNPPHLKPILIKCIKEGFPDKIKIING